MKRLEDFPKITDNQFKHPQYLHVIYPSVTFSELRTFDLLRLLYGYRIHQDRIYRRIKSWLNASSRGEWKLATTLSWFSSKKVFSVMLNDSLPEDPYVIALKRELSKREHLSKHQRKWARKKCFYPAEL